LNAAMSEPLPASTWHDSHSDIAVSRRRKMRKRIVDEKDLTCAEALALVSTSEDGVTLSGVAVVGRGLPPSSAFFLSTNAVIIYAIEVG